MRIEHKYERIEISPDAGFCHVWEVTITHNDKIYHAEISNVAYNVAYRHGDDYWSGFIYLDEYDEEFDYVLAEDIGATWDKSMDEFEVKEHKLKIKNLLLNSYSKILRWCYKNYIDVNGLIEKGLAIDATGLNIY